MSINKNRECKFIRVRSIVRASQEGSDCLLLVSYNLRDKETRISLRLYITPNVQLFNSVKTTTKTTSMNTNM